MVIKIFYILLLQLYFSKANLHNNALPTSYQSAVPGQNDYPNNVKKVLDCRTRSLPVNYQHNAPLNSGALVLQPLEDETVPKTLQSDPNAEVYVYNDDNGSKENRKLVDDLTASKDSKDDSNDDDTRRKEKNEYLQNEEPKDSRNLNSSTLLGKIVERCLTSKLESAHKKGRLHPEELNGRRKLDVDSNEILDREDKVESEDLNEEDQLVDPAEGESLRRLTGSNKNAVLTSNKRVCYACTSASNPNCWLPNRLTTVKYCKTGVNSCTTKTYNAGGQLVVIRDCGSTCKSEIGIDPAYNSCSVCKTDFCNDKNGAYSVNSQGLILCILVISAVKTVF